MKSSLRNCIIYIALVSIIIFFLGFFNIKFMSWVYCVFSIVPLAFLIIGFINLLKRSKKKIIILLFFMVILIFCVHCIVLINKLLYKPQYVITANDKKMVAEVVMFHNTNILYYDYINPFMMSKKNEDFEVLYIHCAKDPFKIENKYVQLIDKNINYYFQMCLEHILSIF